MSLLPFRFSLIGGMTGVPANRRTYRDFSPTGPTPTAGLSGLRIGRVRPQCKQETRHHSKALDKGALTAQTAAKHVWENTMKITTTLTLGLALVAGTAFGAPLKLTPADPQPTEADLSPGLAVSYAFGAGGRTLAEAEAKLARAKPGTPLVGLSYLEGSDGEDTLTSGKAHKIAAAISGFIKFDAAGTFEVDFLSNDGLAASIGGQQVALFDGVHSCEPAGAVEVEVPQAGWYALEATYFQRKGGACLLMDWSVSGEMEPVPDAAFAFIKK